MATYNLQLTRPEQDALLGNIETGACGNQGEFDSEAILAYFKTMALLLRQTYILKGTLLIQQILRISF